MEADWEVEIGGGAHVIEPDWAGYVDISRIPEAAAKLPEAAELPGLAQVLMRLNAEDLPVWTAKCDTWELKGFDPNELGVESAGDQAGAACYVDLLMRGPANWAAHHDAADWCKRVCERLRRVVLRSCRLDLVVRAAELAEGRAGFAVTAYASAAGRDADGARRRLVDALAALADTLIQMAAHDESAKKLQ